MAKAQTSMAMAASLLLITSCLLSLVLCSSGGRLTLHGDDSSFQVLSVESLLPASICSPSKATGGRNSLKVVDRHGPCYANAGSKPDPLQVLAKDSLRVASLQARLFRAAAGTAATTTQLHASEVSLPAQRGTNFGSANYVVTLGFGTPKKDQTVVFDTGSNVCWIQCEPCAGSCYRQQEPIFDPSASSTYRNVTCSSTLCSNLPIRGCYGAGTCLYGVRYGDNSTTIGFLATETLTLTTTNVFPSFVFGCGQSNSGLFGKAAGLMGLGRNPYSLASQTASRLGNVFSYCLPRTSSTTGYLTLGKTSASNPVYTAMLTDPRAPTLYFIDLIGISVGGVQLPVSATVFRSAGTIIDSGTVITRLPPSAYSALRSAFRSAMSQYPLAQPVAILDTCYDFSKAANISYPPITLRYSGADITLGSAGVFYVFDASRVCLAFAGNADASTVGIIGNVQQRTYEVIYNNVAKKIGFAAGTCG